MCRRIDEKEDFAATDCYFPSNMHMYLSSFSFYRRRLYCWMSILFQLEFRMFAATCIFVSNQQWFLVVSSFLLFFSFIYFDVFVMWFTDGFVSLVFTSSVVKDIETLHNFLFHSFQISCCRNAYIRFKIAHIIQHILVISFNFNEIFIFSLFFTSLRSISHFTFSFQTFSVQYRILSIYVNKLWIKFI